MVTGLVLGAQVSISEHILVLLINASSLLHVVVVVELEVPVSLAELVLEQSVVLLVFDVSWHLVLSNSTVELHNIEDLSSSEHLALSWLEELRFVAHYLKVLVDGLGNDGIVCRVSDMSRSSSNGSEEHSKTLHQIFYLFSNIMIIIISN